MRQTISRILILMMFFVLAVAGAHAQANATVSGTITDQTGAAVSGAQITLTDPSTGLTRSTTSDSSGLYGFYGLNAAKYNLKVNAKGFKVFEQTGIVVNISMTFSVNAKLTIGAETQTVQVTADALTVQADSNVISTLISEQQMETIATNGRNVVSLATLGLGVSANLPDMNAPTSVGANYAISFNGLNQAHNIWILDGGEAYDRGSGGKMSMMPSQDALGEFNVLSSNYPPDYGISSGGTVTMSIKNGTSKLHGNAWEYIRNDAIQGHNYFDTNASTGVVSPKAELRYNVFGFNVGGPVIIPHVYNPVKKKTFFFVNEEWRKEINGQPVSNIATVPAGDNPTTAADFTFKMPGFAPSTQTQVFVPTVADPAFNAKLATAGLTPGTPFPGNVIPGSLLDSNAMLFNGLNNIPSTTNASSTFSPPKGKLPTNVHEDIVRIDQTINDKWQLFGDFLHDSVSQSYSTVLWNNDTYPSVGSSFSNPSYAAVIKLTGTLSPNMLLEAAFNYDGNKIAILPVAAGGGSFTQPTGWTAQSYFDPKNNQMSRLPNLNLTTYPKAGGGNQAWGPGNDPWKNGAEDYNEIVSLSITKSKHQFKFGGEYNRYTKNQINGSQTEGSYTFNDGWNTETLKPTGDLTGDSYLDFDLGLATTFAQAGTDPTFHYVNNTISVYAMDNWHVTPRLTLQLGIRYDALPHVWERNNQISNFVPSQYQTALAPVFTSSGAFASNSPGLQTINGTQFYMNGIAIAGQNGTPRGIVKNDYKTLQPRIGFSYDVFGTGKTILRGGFGTFYERMQGNDIYDIAGNAPFVNSPSASNVEFTNTSYNWQAGAAASSPLFPAGPSSENTYYPAPGVAMYSIGVQHEILPALIWQTQYVGNIGWHQNTFLPINNFPLSTPLATREASAGGTLSSVDTSNARNYPGFGGMSQITNPLTSSYNSFQTGIRQQDRHGFSYEVDYTWSHEIDDQVGSNDLNTTSNPFNLKYDRGSGSLDRRQILSANYLYIFPFFMHQSGIAHTVIGGWQISGTFIAQSGLPWAGNSTPGSGFADTVGLGGGYTNRADRAPGVSIKYTHGKKDANGIPTLVTNSNGAFIQPVAAWNGGANLGFGNTGRDAIVGPGRVNFNTSLYKTFAFNERFSFQFRAETYNTFNHTQFATGGAAGNVNLNVSSGTFGEYGGAADPRTWQFGGRFTF